jgi:hypothetical protein
MLAAAAAIWRAHSRISHDVAWYLVVAERILDGAVLYEDIIEVNPPLGMWFAVPSVFIARLYGIGAIGTFTGFTLLLALLSLGLSANVLRRSGLSAGIPLLVLALALFFLPGRDFGQREHLLFTLCVPWLLLRSARLDAKTFPVPLALVLGALAALGVALKVHALVGLIAVELWCLLKQRSLRTWLQPEHLALAVTGIAYALLVWTFAPGFFGTNLRLGIEAYLPYYDVSGSVTQARALVGVVMTGLLIALAERERGHWSALISVLAASLLGFTIAYGLQPGFGYQFLPAASALMVAMGLVAVAARSRIVRLVALCVIATPLLHVLPASEGNRNAFFAALLDRYRPDARSFFVASTNVSSAFPLAIERQLQWTSRFPTQWLAPHVAEHGWNTPIAELARRFVVDDLIAGRPDIVIVDTRLKQSYFKDKPLDFLAFWDTDPRFGPLWSEYRRTGTHLGFEVWIRDSGVP